MVRLEACREGPIPAGAGETTYWRQCRDCIWAYPRGRGGNRVKPLQGLAGHGLSPRARGKLAAKDSAFRSAGPIPAGAGETETSESAFQHVAAYPRGRGGNDDTKNVFVLAQGLSPRARGKHHGEGVRLHGRGPIPAGAGETKQWDSWR